MKKFIIITLIVVLFNNYIKADNNITDQTDANIYGHVLDKKTNEHLPYATVKLQGTTIGITTDGTGPTF